MNKDGDGISPAMKLAITGSGAESIPSLNTGRVEFCPPF
jgi:hypothetical protein